MGIHFRSPHLGWAVGTGGVILKTTDGGRRWRPVTSGTTSQITSVFFADAQHGWVVGANGIILHSKDGGEKWHLQNSGTQSPLYGVYFLTTSIGWAVGGAGTILSTDDGGAHWIDQPSGTNAILYGVHFLDEAHGGVSGALGTILLTEDGGKTWRGQEIRSAGTFFDIVLTGPTDAWTVGNAGSYVSNARWRQPLDRPDAAVRAHLLAVDRLTAHPIYRRQVRLGDRRAWGDLSDHGRRI